MALSDPQWTHLFFYILCKSFVGPLSQQINLGYHLLLSNSERNFPTSLHVLQYRRHRNKESNEVLTKIKVFLLIVKFRPEFQMLKHKSYK